MTSKSSNRFPPEVRQRVVRMVLEHGGDHASQWSAVGSNAANVRDMVNACLCLQKIGCQWHYLPEDLGPWQTVRT